MVESAALEELVDATCIDCGEEFNFLFGITLAEGAEETEENASLPGSRCTECMVAKFPDFEEEIVGYSEILDMFLAIQSKYMTKSEWEELYGEVDDKQ